MIQFIKFHTLDPIGYAIVKLDDISGIASTSGEAECRLITCHGEYLVQGNINFLIGRMQDFVGGEFSACPEEFPNE